ncbi:hypothetical protein ACT4ZA_02495 [Acinetobacter baumannii]
MMKNNWLIDHLKLNFILDQKILIKGSLIADIFSFDIENVSKEKKDDELIELFLDEENDILYKIQYDENKNFLSFTFSEKKLDSRSNFLFEKNEIERLVIKICTFFSNHFSKISISLSIYIQNESIDKNILKKVFKKNNFNYLSDIDLNMETFDFSVGDTIEVDGINFRLLKNFLFFDGAKVVGKVSIKKLGKDQIFFFKQNVVLESDSSDTVLKIFKLLANQV